MMTMSWVKLSGQVGGKPREKRLGEWGKECLSLVVPKATELFTKLSTVFSTTVAEIFPRIHRLYYYNNLY